MFVSKFIESHTDETAFLFLINIHTYVHIFNKNQTILFYPIHNIKYIYYFI
jgi:hypothetical protein